MSRSATIAAVADEILVTHYVYLVVCGDGARVYIKIGRSMRPFIRFKDIQVGCPMPIEFVGTIHVPSKEEAKKLELAIQVKMNKWHIQGEWIVLEHKDRGDFRIMLHDVLKMNSRRHWPLSIKIADKQPKPRRVAEFACKPELL